MSGLARYFHSHGVVVRGYDRTCTPLTVELEKEGIAVHYEEEPNNIPADIDLVCYTPAIPKDNKELQYILNKGFPLKKRSEILGMLSKDKFTIAIAGTHGKTSITSMTAHILKQAGLNVTAFIGGISKNYNTNILQSTVHSPQSIENNNGIKEIMVVEADEYDRSFLTLNPDIAVITAMDADHLDIYGSERIMQDAFMQFAGQVKKEKGVLVVSSKFKVQSSKFKDFNYSKGIAKTRTYSLNPDITGFAYANHIKIENNNYIFDITTGRNTIFGINYHIPGRHNIENAIAAATIANELGISSNEIKKGLETYEGVVRRFDCRVNTSKKVYIDDYAHHPEELKACISAVRELYSNRKITGIFQPHLYSRTRDLADGFADALNMLDELILLDIYPAREIPIEGVSSEMIFNKISLKDKIQCKKEEVLKTLKNMNIEVLLTLGAGDIDTLVDPIAKLLMN